MSPLRKRAERGWMRRIAFFGGSFDPPHCGHLAIAKAAANRFSLDKVLFAPVGKQPLKAAGADAPFIHRYAMTVLATQTDARFILLCWMPRWMVIPEIAQ